MVTRRDRSRSRPEGTPAARRAVRSRMRAGRLPEPRQRRPLESWTATARVRSEQSVHMSAACTDIRGFNNEWNQNTWDGRFYDNNEYIGHDEPDMTFLSHQHGSGNDVTWTDTLPRDPSAAPTDSNPGHDVAHWFELSPAPWFSMAMCDSNSYPQAPCTPESDSNAPRAAPVMAAARRSWRSSSIHPGCPVRGFGQLRQQPLVRRTDDRQPRVHDRASQPATATARSRSTSRFIQTQRGAGGPGEPQASSDLASETPNSEHAADEPRRHDSGPHVRRPDSGRWWPEPSR